MYMYITAAYLFCIPYVEACITLSGAYVGRLKQYYLFWEAILILELFHYASLA